MPSSKCHAHYDVTLMCSIIITDLYSAFRSEDTEGLNAGDTPLVAASSCVIDVFVERKTLAVRCVMESLYRPYVMITRSSAVAKRPRHASCLYSFYTLCVATRR